MADTPVQVDSIASGQTGLVLRLFGTTAQDWDTQANADAAGTEGTNAKTVYQFTVAEDVTGMKRAIVFDADGNPLWCGYVFMTNTVNLHVAHLLPSDALAMMALTITPLSVTVSAGEVTEQKLVAYQHHEEAFTFAIVDSTGAAVDLTGKDVEFLAYRVRSVGKYSSVITLTTGDGVTVGGDEGNQVTVAVDGDDTAAAAELNYVLRNTTDDQVLAVGTLTIKPLPA